MVFENTVFEEVRVLVGAGRSPEALVLLGQLHREWHDSPLEHVFVHWWLMRIAWHCQCYRRAAWEMFALVFAAPVSLVQRYLGLARKNI
jgi:hypothetical protein